jgi:hypothetical protein
MSNHTDNTVAHDQETTEKKMYIDYRQRHVRPWVRFFAKGFDIWVVTVIVYLFYMLIFKSIDYKLQMLTSFVMTMLWFLLVEPYCLTQWGTTLGRILFNFNLRTRDEKRLTLAEARARSFNVWLYGYALGIPILSIFSNYVAYRRLKKTGTTSWDKNKYIVTHGPLGVLRVCLIIVIMLLPFFVVMTYQVYYHMDRVSSTETIHSIHTDKR